MLFELFHVDVERPFATQGKIRSVHVQKSNSNPQSPPRNIQQSKSRSNPRPLPHLGEEGHNNDFFSITVLQ